MSDAVGETTPSSRPNSRKQRPTDPTPPRKLPPPYSRWNTECDKLIRMRKAALRQFQHRGTRDNFNNYKKADAKARNGLKRIKKVSFTNFTESLTRFTNPKYIWRIIKALKNRCNYRDNSKKYNEENLNKPRTMIDELCPP
jgi:hypothetical protein